MNQADVRPGASEGRMAKGVWRRRIPGFAGGGQGTADRLTVRQGGQEPPQSGADRRDFSRVTLALWGSVDRKRLSG